MEKNSLASSSDEESTAAEKEKPAAASKQRRAVVSSSDEELTLPKKHARNTSVIDSSDDQAGSRTPSRSPSVNSLDDSRAKSPTQWVLTPKKGSQLNHSRRSFNDSTLSTNSSLGSNRSPLSSPLSSRSVSPSTPMRSQNPPAAKSTPATKRLRETPGTTENVSKKSRVLSPKKSVQLPEDSPVKKIRGRKPVIQSDSE